MASLLDIAVGGSSPAQTLPNPTAMNTKEPISKRICKYHSGKVKPGEAL